MGQEIQYCYKCLKRLTGGDFDRGAGTRLGNRASCTDCLPELLASLTPDEKRQFAQQLSRPKDTRRRELPRSSSTSLHPMRSSSVRMAAAPASRGSSTALVWGIVGAAVAAVVVVAIWPSAPPPAPPPPPVVVKKAAPVEDPRLKPAKEAVERAKRTSGDLETRIAAWAEALRASAGTPHAADALAAHEALVAERSAARAKEAAELDAQTRALLDQEDFGGAQSHLEAVRKRHDRQDWQVLVDQALSAVRAKAEAALAARKVKAVEAARSGAEAEVAALRAQVSGWRMPSLLEDLDKALGAVADEGWTPLFDGRDTKFLRGSSREHWTVADGALMRKPGNVNAGQTHQDFTDVELRIRFEARGVDNLWFALRQADSLFKIYWNTERYAEFGDGEHELIFRCKGPSAGARLDGRPVPVNVFGTPTAGPLQFNAEAGLFRILSIHQRPPR